MSLFNRIAIGTANWGKKYRGVQVPQKDKERILEMCLNWEIDTIDTAVAYENDVYDIVGFNLYIIDKIQHPEWNKDHKPHAILGHVAPCKMVKDWLDECKLLGYCKKTGWSVYSDDVKPKCDILQIPYNPYDATSRIYLDELEKGDMEIHVRSVFCAGKALKDYSAKDCIAFALMNPKIDKVIVGVDSFDQFCEGLEWIHRLEDNARSNPEYYDTRRF